MATATAPKPRYRRVIRDGWATLLLDGREVHSVSPAETTLDELIAEYECDQHDRRHRIGHYAEEAA